MAKKTVTTVANKVQELKDQIRRLDAFSWIIERCQRDIEYNYQQVIRDENGDKVLDENGDWTYRMPTGPEDFTWDGEKQWAEYIAKTKALNELIEYVTKG